MWFYVIDETFHRTFHRQAVCRDDNCKKNQDWHHDLTYFFNSLFYTTYYNDSSECHEQEEPAQRLESAADENGIIHPLAGETGIFIYPGYHFKATDALITNFHLPESTLLMLVSALYNRDEILKAYRIAVKERYRFFSFGDAMLIQ